MARLAIRLPSLIADAVTAAIVATLALRLFADRRIALSAGALTAVSLPLIFWGQDARGYSLMAALGAGSYLALVAILQTPAGERPAAGAVAAYGLTTLTAVYVGLRLAAARRGPAAAGARRLPGPRTGGGRLPGGSRGAVACRCWCLH